MLAASHRHRDRAMAGWQGVKALEELFGTGRGRAVGSAVRCSTGWRAAAAPCPARRHRHRRAHELARATIANVESYEFRFPILYLYRRQTTDSGGAGRVQWRRRDQHDVHRRGGGRDPDQDPAHVRHRAARVARDGGWAIRRHEPVRDPARRQTSASSSHGGRVPGLRSPSSRARLECSARTRSLRCARRRLRRGLTGRRRLRRSDRPRSRVGRPRCRASRSSPRSGPSVSTASSSAPTAVRRCLTAKRREQIRADRRAARCRAGTRARAGRPPAVEPCRGWVSGSPSRSSTTCAKSMSPTAAAAVTSSVRRPRVQEFAAVAGSRFSGSGPR